MLSNGKLLTIFGWYAGITYLTFPNWLHFLIISTIIEVGQSL